MTIRRVDGATLMELFGHYGTVLSFGLTLFFGWPLPLRRSRLAQDGEQQRLLYSGCSAYRRCLPHLGCCNGHHEPSTQPLTPKKIGRSPWSLCGICKVRILRM